MGHAQPRTPTFDTTTDVVASLTGLFRVDKVDDGRIDVTISVTLLTDHPDGSISRFRAPSCNCGT